MSRDADWTIVAWDDLDALKSKVFNKTFTNHFEGSPEEKIYHLTTLSSPSMLAIKDYAQNKTKFHHYSDDDLFAAARGAEFIGHKGMGRAVLTEWHDRAMQRLMDLSAGCFSESFLDIMSDCRKSDHTFSRLFKISVSHSAHQADLQRQKIYSVKRILQCLDFQDVIVSQKTAGSGEFFRLLVNYRRPESWDKLSSLIVDRKS